MLDRVCPFQGPVAAPDTVSSMVVRLPRGPGGELSAGGGGLPRLGSGRFGRPPVAVPAPRAPARPPAGGGGERTMEFDAILDLPPPPGGGAPADEPSDLAFPELTQVEDALLERASRTGEFEPIDRSEMPTSAGELPATRTSDAEGILLSSDTNASTEGKPFLEPQVGGFLGEFELTDVLGQGGMGVVFRCVHAQSRDVYAIKVLRVREGAATDQRRERFRREVEAMQRLQHPGIIAVHGYGRDGPFDWYVMDYVEGQDLSALLRDGALDMAAKVEVFDRICAAVGHSHAQAVVHRDLKPQNVLVGDDRTLVKVLDFGLAKILDSEIGLTHTGSALGTPYYMSPEQVADPTRVGPPSDVFALGIILYEMISGQRPFVGHSAGEVGNKILTQDPPLPSRFNPDVHGDLDAICMKALEKNPERRYGSAEALRADLERHRSGKGVRGPSSLDSVRTKMERHREGLVMGIAIATAVFLVVAGVGGAALYFLQFK